MRRIVAAALTLAILGLMVWSANRGGSLPTAAREDGPEEHLHRLLQKAREGDVTAYLDAFGPPIREKLEREVAERGLFDFAYYLKKAAATRKGLVVYDPERDGDQATILVESIYLDHNERQRYHLKRSPSGWRVIDVETSRPNSPADPYGQPVN
ncbi:MAG: hypothetical protein U0800_18700 [Isosphaeraceae bacterium]